MGCGDTIEKHYVHMARDQFSEQLVVQTDTSHDGTLAYRYDKIQEIADGLDLCLQSALRKYNELNQKLP